MKEPSRLQYFFFNDTATTEIYTSVHTLSLHDALPICDRHWLWADGLPASPGSARSPRSEEHTSELQSRTLISYAVFCLKKKNIISVNFMVFFFDVVGWSVFGMIL